MNIPSRDYMKLGEAIRSAIDASKADRNDKTATFLTSLHQDGYEIVPIRQDAAMAQAAQMMKAATVATGRGDAVRDAAE